MKIILNNVFDEKIIEWKVKVMTCEDCDELIKFIEAGINAYEDWLIDRK